MQNKLLNAGISIILILCTLSCNADKKKPIYNDTSVTYSEEETYASPGDEIIVPFRSENGIKYVQVKVNGVGLEMIFDTGCSGTLISLAEANYLYQKRSLTQDDIIGKGYSTIADGSIVENMVINLSEVIINDQIKCDNVTATVSNNLNAPLLLGNEILDRTATITIDNENSVLHFKLK